MSNTGKKLNELRVTDLKSELESRELDVIGSKAMLIERLEQALIEEGLDPAVFEFVISPEKKSLSPNKNALKIKSETLDEINADEHKENGDNANTNDELDDVDEIDEVGECDDECITFVNSDDDEVETLTCAEEMKKDIVQDEENNGEANKYDQDESINLTIGEEEQKLLHDEAIDDKDKSAVAGETAKDVTESKDNKNEKTAANKDDRKNAKDDDNKSKNKDNVESDKKSSPNKSSQADDKEKSTNATSSKVTPSRSTNSTSKSTTTAASRNLWVSGLSTLTRASDLKTIFSKYGKVIGAKVVTNTRTPGTRCFGYVTMYSSSDAGRCIEHLYRTELHGRIISVERTKNEIGTNAGHVNRDNMLKNVSTSDSAENSKTRDDDKKSISSKDAKSHDDKRKHDDKGHSRRDRDRDHHHRDKERDDGKKPDDGTIRKSSKDRPDDTNRTSSRARSDRENDRERGRQRERERERDRERERERERARQREILSYQKIREERERQRLRERERELREEERRRHEIRDRQRQEEQRLEEERKKLAQERYRLEREKAELLRLERERQKLEREKIELERLELKRQQMKIMQARDDPVKRLGAKRSADDHYNDAPDRKRGTQNDARFDAPPPPRFDASLISSTRSYDKKRDDYTTSSGNKRGGLEDYNTSTKYSASAKRSVVDEYSGLSTKRNTDDYSKRGGGGGGGSSSGVGGGGGNDYIGSGNKRGVIDDYGNKSSRDDYKREVEIRHLPSNNVSSSGGGGGGGGGSYHKSGNNASGGGRYSDAATSNYRRGGGGGGGVMDDLSMKNRYDNSGGYSSMNSSGGNNGMWSSTGHNSGGMSSLMHGSGGGTGGSNCQKSIDDSLWRQLQTSQDRYDRTYNERSSGGYAGGGNSGAMFTNNGRQQDRYGGGGGGGMSRY